MFNFRYFIKGEAGSTGRRGRMGSDGNTVGKITLSDAGITFVFYGYHSQIKYTMPLQLLKRLDWLKQVLAATCCSGLFLHIIRWYTKLIEMMPFQKT